MKRIYHTWDKWECYPAGFYENKPHDKSLSDDDCMRMYAEFLADEERFKAAMQRVITEWKHSCEHYLTNEKMNRIAWMGQAAMCIETGIPSRYCGGFNQLTEEQQAKANELAAEYISKWMEANGGKRLTVQELESKSKANIY